MSEKRHASKVGLFIFIGLVLVAALMLNFSRGLGLFQDKYELKVRVRNVAGLKPRSSVSLAGIEIGKVKDVELDPRNQSALVHLEILKKYQLPEDSRFIIEQLNVLGDVAVKIEPGTPGRRTLAHGDEVAGDQPFNLQEVAQSANALLKRFEQLGGTVETAITRLNDQVLDANTLSNLSRTIQNMQGLSDHVVGLIDNASALIDDASGVISNAAPVFALSLTNLYEFSRKLDKVAMEVDETIITNRVELNQAMKNLRDATASLKEMTAEMQSGKGLAGGLLKDEQLRGQVSFVVSNLAVLSSNLNRYGLLYKPKQPKNTAPVTYPGKGQ